MTPRVKLVAWLAERNIKDGAFGSLIPVSKDVMSAILRGARKPRPEVADRIEALTDGAVKASEWATP